MKTLHLYLTRQILATLAMTSIVFTFVLLLANVLKEVLALLVSKQATLGVVGEAIGLLVPFVWTFALPMGMLTATLLVFGRFSADQELTAARASGVSLVSLIAPVLALSLVLCGISAWMNMEICPRAWTAYRELIRNFKVDIANAQLPERRFIKEIDNYILYIGKNNDRHLEDVMIYMLKEKTTIHAPRGEFQYNAASNQINLQLFDCKSLTLSEGRATPGVFSEWSQVLDLNKAKPDNGKANLNSMTYSQLREELHALQLAVTLPIGSLTNLTAEQRLARKQEFDKLKTDLTLPLRVQMNRQVALSFACFGFTLVGIPLAIRLHRRETNVGIMVAVGLAALYYVIVFAAKAFDTRAELSPQLLVWLPNFIFQAVGAVLLWGANRGI